MILTLGNGFTIVYFRISDPIFYAIINQKSYDSQVDLDEWADERSERDEVTDECLPIECDYIENICRAEMQKVEF